MKQVFCSNCGFKLEITRLVVKKAGAATILDTVPPHQCDKVIEPELETIPTPTFEKSTGDEKFVQKLNELGDPHSEGQGLSDHRPPDQVKQTTSAPNSVIDILERMKREQG